MVSRSLLLVQFTVGYMELERSRMQIEKKQFVW